MIAHLERPESICGRSLFWSYLAVFLGFHLLLPLMFVPSLFSWTGVALVFIGNYVFGSLGINIGYHRLLTHRSFRCPLWLEHSFAVLGVCSLQDSPGRWVAIHRMHHQHSDQRPDPHSPLVSFFWGHMGWLIIENRTLDRLSTYDRYARDVFQDRFYRRLHRNHFWLWIYAAHALIILALGMLAGWCLTESPREALQFGLSIFVWGVIVRTVYVWHITWAVNSVTHLWGYQNYATGENSRNNWIVALLTNGEGWHNNHHANQRSAAHGHRWWELDLTFLTILLLRKVGLATDVVTPGLHKARRDSKDYPINENAGSPAPEPTEVAVP
ncbi:acyl-CoA desaturase [Tundrisphaera lichenicola]|uniref:acyl-CoA desaturase n=1 Tax=Tundrisphaera lichenicola TaxID=2029860 RepID=UPI003EBF58F4